MKIHRNKLILLAFALQILMLLSVIALVYCVSGSGQVVVLDMYGYDPYDALRGRYLRLSLKDNSVILEPGSRERYENGRDKGDRQVYVILDTDSASGLSSFAYASLDRPDHGIPYIKCRSAKRIYSRESRISIHPRINQYYLNENHANVLDRSIHRDTNIRLVLNVWHGMYVIDGVEIDGVRY